MDEKPSVRSPREQHKGHREDAWPMQHWRAWGSWFSWGSPIGLTLGYAIVMISTGVFIWLLSAAQ